MTTTYTFHQDPGHGWLEVSMDELRSLGLADGITQYSYRQGDTAYLEEDCDAGAFLKTKKELGQEFRIVERQTNHDHWIRNLANFPRPAVPAWERFITTGAVHG